MSPICCVEMVQTLDNYEDLKPLQATPPEDSECYLEREKGMPNSQPGWKEQPQRHQDTNNICLLLLNFVSWCFGGENILLAKSFANMM